MYVLQLILILFLPPHTGLKKIELFPQAYDFPSILLVSLAHKRLYFLNLFSLLNFTCFSSISRETLIVAPPPLVILNILSCDHLIDLYVEHSVIKKCLPVSYFLAAKVLQCSLNLNYTKRLSY